MGPFKRAKKLRKFKEEWGKLSQQPLQFTPVQDEKVILKQEKKSHDEIRQQLWCDIAVAYTGASNATHKERAAIWADQVVKDFDKRFKDEVSK